MFRKICIKIARILIVGSIIFSLIIFFISYKKPNIVIAVSNYYCLCDYVEELEIYYCNTDNCMHAYIKEPEKEERKYAF